jgi:hypothetical protein
LESYFPGSNLDQDFPFVYPQSGKLQSSKTFAFGLFGVSDLGGATKHISHHPTVWAVA